MFPAPAGMSPKVARWIAGLADVPRTRGDEPHQSGQAAMDKTCSPHPRG